MRARSHALSSSHARPRASIVTLLPLVASVLAFSGHVDARTAEAVSIAQRCQLERAGSTLKLRADRSTRTTIVIPDGFTLDGQNHRITAIDPRGGSFRGAVLENGGREAHVRSVVVRAVELGAHCAALSAIALHDCSGSVTDSVIEGVYRRGAACGEGDGISIRANARNPNANVQHVAITGNRIEGFAHAGVVVEGVLEANVHLNRITFGDVHGVASQQGVHMARGATGSVRWNVVRALANGARRGPSTGLLVSETAGPIELALNRIESADIGVGLRGAGGTRVEDNAFRDQRRAAIRVDGRNAPATDNRIRNNRIGSVAIGVWLDGALARENDISPGIDLDLRPGTVRETSGAHDNLIRPE